MDSNSVTFAEQMSEVIRKHEGERWRLGVTRSLSYWKEFISGWASAAWSLKRIRAEAIVPPDIVENGPEAFLSWAWNLVEHETNAVLMAVDMRTSIPSAVVVSHFRVLSGNGLIFPDGSCCSYVLRAVERAVNVDEATEQGIIASAVRESNRLRVVPNPKQSTKIPKKK